ncbi:uncharacterized protein LOC135171368 [Diachasmimorpha longicaudata]|uniref:uncharacterized protein LOC135171368 n=1 Tax=Diachasmimorpha longicaudata TaxID=58733 RepID=UPI0030B8C184
MDSKDGDREMIAASAETLNAAAAETDVTKQEMEVPVITTETSVETPKGGPSEAAALMWSPLTAYRQEIWALDRQSPGFISALNTSATSLLNQLPEHPPRQMPPFPMEEIPPCCEEIQAPEPQHEPNLVPSQDDPPLDNVDQVEEPALPQLSILPPRVELFLNVPSPENPAQGTTPSTLESSPAPNPLPPVPENNSPNLSLSLEPTCAPIPANPSEEPIGPTHQQARSFKLPPFDMVEEETPVDVLELHAQEDILEDTPSSRAWGNLPSPSGEPSLESTPPLREPTPMETDSTESPRARPYPTTKKAVRCHRCRERGHGWPNCPSTSTHLFCIVCGAWGVDTFACPRKDPRHEEARKRLTRLGASPAEIPPPTRSSNPPRDRATVPKYPLHGEQSCSTTATRVGNTTPISPSQRQSLSTRLQRARETTTTEATPKPMAIENLDHSMSRPPARTSISTDEAAVNWASLIDDPPLESCAPTPTAPEATTSPSTDPFASLRTDDALRPTSLAIPIQRIEPTTECSSGGREDHREWNLEMREILRNHYVDPSRMPTMENIERKPPTIKIMF